MKNQAILRFFYATLCIIVIYSFRNPDFKKSYSEISTSFQKDNEELNSILIGTQTWMTKNLNVETFKNGDTIPVAKTPKEWYTLTAKEKKPACCYFDFDPANGVTYGKLYNWYAVNDPRGLAPAGWHVPSDSEWNTLIDFLGGSDVAGGRLKSEKGWFNKGNGKKTCGFNALPGGEINSMLGFSLMEKFGNWWSSNERDVDYASVFSINYSNPKIFNKGNYKDTGYSVRCIKD